MASNKRMTEVQGRLVAHMWGAGRTIPVGKEETPTKRACIRNGWLKGTGATGLFPNGTHFELFEVSEVGLAALGDYLRRRAAAMGQS